MTFNQNYTTFTINLIILLQLYYFVKKFVSVENPVQHLMKPQ